MTVDAPQGPVPAIGIPDSQDYPRLVFTAPYFQTVPLAELIEPAVTEAVEAALPSLVPPYVQDAANAAVQQLAVLIAGSTMQGPLFLNPVMPVQPAQAASMAYVDAMVATAGIPEVPPTPIGQVWARMTGQWTPISEEGGTFLPIGGGVMQGQINMSGNAIINLPALPVMPNGAAPAQWVLNQIASVSLYQGTWDMDTYTPDLTQLSTHVNGWTWIAITTSVSGVVIGPPIPGLQGKTIFNGDTVIFSATAGAFQSIHGGGLSLAEAEALFLALAGGQMSGALLLNADATQPTQAVTLQQLTAATANAVTPDAPTDGQLYGRNGLTKGWSPVLPLTGGVTTGPILLSGNATNALQAVPYQQLTSYVTGNAVMLTGSSMTGLLTLSGNASANLNPVPLQQLNAMVGSYLPLGGGTITGSLTVNGDLSVWQQLSAMQTFWLTGNGTSDPGIAIVAPSVRQWGIGVGQADGTFYVMDTTGDFYRLTIDTGGTVGIGGNLNVTGTVGIPGTLVVGTLQALSSPAYVSCVNDLHVSAGSLNSGTVWTDKIAAATASAAITCESAFNSTGLISGSTVGVGGGLVWQNNAGFMYCGSSISVFSIALDNQTPGSCYWALNSGYMYCPSSVMANAFVDGSDVRTKTNIEIYTPGVSAISQLNPITFQYNGRAETPSDGATRIGLDAAAVQKIIPVAVGTRSGKLDPNNATETTDLLTLDSKPILMALINAVKQLLSRVQELEAAASITPTSEQTA